MCMIDAADGLGNRCQREARRRARKAHKCGECSRVIAPGETYVDASGIDCDGNAWTHKVCALALWFVKYIIAGELTTR